MPNSKIWDAYDKNCWFYEDTKLSYFTFKNGIWIARPKRHVTSTRDNNNNNNNNIYLYCTVE